jgi:chromosome segregation ATPase
MENIPEPSSYKETLDQLLEFKKLAYNLEKEVNKKENERQKFIQLYNDLKDLHQKVQSQNNDFREQIIKLLEEKKSIENKYKNENKLLKENLENQKENYEKLLRINNQFEENTLKKKIESETESRYSTLLNEKDIENRDLSDKVNNLMKENVKLETEYDEYKKQTQSEIERLNEKYDKDIKEMINKFNEYKSNLDNIIIKPNENEISPLLISE